MGQWYTLQLVIYIANYCAAAALDSSAISYLVANYALYIRTYIVVK